MVLRSLEQKLESLLEGVFGRAFKTNVQPVELARKLAKEMDEHRTISVSRVYVPNEYVLYLSTGDREQFSGYEASLLGELQEYLIEHARREGYALLTQPRVLMETDSDLADRRVRDRDAHGAAEGRGPRRRRARGRGRRDDDLQAAHARARARGPRSRRPPPSGRSSPSSSTGRRTR